MIDYHTLYLWRYFMQTKMLKALSKRGFESIPDKRTKSLYRAFLQRKSPVIKYYVTANQKKVIDQMDLTHIECSDLEFLRDRLPNECGFIFFENGLHCMYAITTNFIAIEVAKGGAPHFGGSREPEFTMFNPLQGLAIAHYTNGLDITTNNLLSLVFAIKDKKVELSELSDHSIAEIRKLDNAFKRYEKEHPDEAGTGTAFNAKASHLQEDYNKREELIYQCLKAFIYVKTAKVINETFIPFETGIERPYTKSDYGTSGVIKVDGFYDRDIDVVAPFSVRGHFRNQPKKNEQGEWYKELIYIDSFMKQGYHRTATKDKI